MAVYANNFLQTVQTYQRSGLALLQNMYCHLAIADKKFKNFQDIRGNLGSTVTFDLPPRAVTNQGLVASWQPLIQRVQALSVDQANNSSFTIDDQQRLFNLEKPDDEYVRVFTKSFIAELAGNVEQNIALNWISGVTSQADANYGALNTASGPYRYYGNGTTPLSSFGQLAKAIAYYKNYGAVNEDISVVLPDVIVPDIVSSGLGQFAMKRNDAMAEDYLVGSFGSPMVDYYQSNLLPVHYSGNTGVNQQVLTVVSTNDPTGQNVTQITFSGATNSDQYAVKAGDLFQFQDNVSGFSNLRYLTFIVHAPSSNPVQFRATADAASNSSGNVTVSITPALNWAGGNTKNLTSAIQAGMQVLGLPSHRAGGVCGKGSLFLAMPQLPDQTPFPTANEYDPDTGVSIRMAYGSIFGQNQQGIVISEIHGSVLVPEYSLRYIIPMTQA